MYPQLDAKLVKALDVYFKEQPQPKAPKMSTSMKQLLKLAGRNPGNV